MVSQILGDFYEVERQIAKKAGRRTFLCRDLRSLDLVVVKLVSFNSDFEWDDLKLFEREAETLKSLSHNAIAKYLDYFELEVRSLKSFALVQTYIPAKSLQEHLQAGRSFSEAEVQELAIALLEILIYLHDRKPAVIHRDLKPSNVLLGDRTGNSIGQVYLVDFGSVHTLAAKEDGTITVVGTYGYMPPEQFGGRTVPASDIYSLGATLIGLLTGTHPADLPQKDGCIQFIQQANIGRSFALWLEQTIQPSLDKRFTSVKQALQKLRNPPQPKENLPIAKKPYGSKVVLNKDINSLEIVIPSAGFKLGMLWSIIIAIAFDAFVCLWTGAGMLSSFPINVAFGLFALPFWVICIAMTRSILWDIFGQVLISLDRQQICLTHKLLGFTYNHLRPTQTQDIIKLEYTKKSFERGPENLIVAIEPHINIWIGVKKYTLTDPENLTTPECDWIAKELSSWLEIPIDYK